MLCNAVSEFCTHRKCPRMKAHTNEYLWANTSGEKVVLEEVSARRYMENLTVWMDGQLNEINSGKPERTAGAVRLTLKSFCRRLLRVYAHIFCHHAHDIKTIEHHMKYSLMNFLLFMRSSEVVINPLEFDPLVTTVAAMHIADFTLPF